MRSLKGSEPDPTRTVLVPYRVADYRAVPDGGRRPTDPKFHADMVAQAAQEVAPRSIYRGESYVHRTEASLTPDYRLAVVVLALGPESGAPLRRYRVKWEARVEYRGETEVEAVDEKDAERRWGQMLSDGAIDHEEGDPEGTGDDWDIRRVELIEEAQTG